MEHKKWLDHLNTICFQIEGNDREDFRIHQFDTVLAYTLEHFSVDGELLESPNGEFIGHLAKCREDILDGSYIDTTELVYSLKWHFERHIFCEFENPQKNNNSRSILSYPNAANH